MQGQSLGMIETLGCAAAVEAVDAACKAAAVSYLGCDRVGMGLVTVKFAGDVGAVKAAVCAGAAAASKVGRVVSVHVIPRPSPQLKALDPGPRGRPEPPPAGKPAAGAPKPEMTAPSEKVKKSKATELATPRATAEAKRAKKPRKPGKPERG